jgi:hypothetical protein
VPKESGTEKILAEALALGMATEEAMLTPEQRALSERLRDRENARSFEDWLQSTLQEPEEFTLSADKAIEELSLVAGVEEAAPLAARYRALLEEPAERRRQMLKDTLMLDVGNALVAAKARTEALRALELEAGCLSLIETPQAKELAQKVSAALAARDSRTAEGLKKQVAAVLDQRRRALAAKAQRSAIINALKELGYEVREGMATVVPQEGKVILRRAANADRGWKWAA